MNVVLFIWGVFEVVGLRLIDVNFFLVSVGILLVGDYCFCYYYNIIFGWFGWWLLE